MKTITLIIAVLVVSFGFVQEIKADPPVNCDISVVGQDDPSPTGDVLAVSTAVNGPHSSSNVTVCLEGTFDFGTGTVGNFVLINPAHISPPDTVAELSIIGINDADRNKATIKNGFQALRFFSFTDPPTNTIPNLLPVLRIKNIHFKDPLFTAISIFRGNQLIEISGNEIDGIKTFLLTPTVPLREGIAVSAVITAINGKILIEENTLDGGNYDPLDLLDVNANSFGIGIIGQAPPPPGANPVNAEVIIRGNTLKNWARSAILVQGLQPVTTIENNLIEPGEFATAFAVPCVANGIELLNVDDDSVMNNTIHKVTSLRADGNPPACTTGILIGFDSSSNLFRANKITGDGTYAINLAGNAVEENNVFIGNNLTGFTPSGATVNLGPNASNNTFVGSSGTVTGNTAANTITGLTPVDGGVGGDLSDAVSDM
jgi:hypothetical protein